MDTVGVRLGHRFGGPDRGVDTADDARAARFAGAYIGAYGGGRWDESDWNTGLATNAHGTGAIAGGFAGYNWQSGHGIFGLEADYSPTQQTSGVACAMPAFFCQMTARQVGSIRPRFGWVIDHTMLYGTGGLAIAQWDATVTNASAGQTVAQTRTLNYGVAVGGGIEQKLAYGLSARAEVMHYGLQGNNVETTGGGSVFNQFQTTVARVGLAWSFF